ncbi:MAG: DNA methyltransferase [Candidatus Omnitrophica bacterium]|nr:DNA methyltransferase [Candidatus Omnitrophota bacterium]
MSDIKWLDWYGCYKESNKPFYVPAAFAHPAKMAIGLCRRIFEFMEEKKMIKKGSIVVDPFAGIGTTLIMGTMLGYRCIGNELEEKFVKLTKENIEKHRKMFEATQRIIPVILQGDSRQLSKLITEQSEVVVSSSPYGQTQGGRGIAKRGYHNEKKRKGVYKRMVDTVYEDKHFSKDNISNLKDGDINAILTSPAYADISTGAGGLNTKPAKKAGQQSGRSAEASSQDTDQKYGRTVGQIARLKDKGVEGIISSPPFNENKANVIHSGDKGKHTYDANESKSRMKKDYVLPENKNNIGSLKGVDAAITSPPFEDSIGSDDPKKRGGLYRDPKRAKDKNLTGTYGKSEGQLGKEKGETYWEAMKQVYIECWKILKKDGHMAIVVKDFYRKGQRVPLCDNTVRLLENIGFKTVYRIRAWTLTETIHDDLFKGETVNRKERKSFFRRNYESKFPNNRIDWEEILICKKISV